MKFPIFSVLVLCITARNAAAAWVTQSISLRPGWNAVHLQVDPAEKAVSSVFQGIQVKSVWRWNETFSSVRYVQDATTLLPKAPGWFSWLPPAAGAAVLNNLNIIEGGKCYLVQLDGAVPVTLAVKGEAVARPLSWIPDSLNMAGFKVDPANKPTVAQFFAGSPAHAGQAVYRMQASGQWTRIAETAAERLNPGEAYWVFTKGQSSFDGLISAQTEQRNTVEYGQSIVEQVVTVRNSSAAAQTVTLNVSPSESPPEAAGESLAGPVPLSLWKQNIASK
ncbi:MAG: hypothetical protein EOP86_28500, partial [Verrucomicrobiaceae bacterium]